MKGIALLLLAGGLVSLGVTSLPDEPAEVKTEVGTAVYIDRLIGDDNGDGIIVEDESGWDCRTHGNGICGPEAA